MPVRQPAPEVPVHAVSGWGMLALQLLAPFGFASLITWFVGHVRSLDAAAFAARNAGQVPDTSIGLQIAIFVVCMVLLFLTWVLFWAGFFIVQPNIGRV